MIQFNLLPDVKLQYVKANRLKYAISFIAVIVAGAALFIFILLLLTVDVFQRNHVNNLNSQITTQTGQLQNTKNLPQILTLQNEVNALPSINNNKPVTTRLIQYVSEITPSTASISNLEVDYTTSQITITGTADTLATVNLFVDTLKLSSYQTSSNSTSKNAFSNVILTSFGYATSSGATYVITANFDPAIFSNSYTSVTLNVPNSSTHSTNQSQSLFKTPPSTSTNSGSTGN